ncbi:MAG: exodeoxyribonuclease III [Lentisphaerae bacterium RIFOXYA12_FULL_48_11]|nr:MAG: exodeoxyribonuclease III [Lentisphaerae bacterium RIFOXYA12_FULL_48_11]
MKIATFNANSVRSRLEIIIAWLKTNEPDVLCIQETKVVDKDFPSPAFVDAGYNVIFCGEKSYNGVALISRQKPSEIRFGFDDGKQADETRLMCAKVGSVYVINTYVPQGREIDHPMYQYKLEWFARLKDYFNRHFTGKTKMLWVGDLNVAPDAIDIHNAQEQANHVCFHVDVRKAFADTMAWGLVDVFRKYHPEPGQYTFFDYRTINAVKRNMGWRIDHIIATPVLAAKSRNSYIDVRPRLMEKPSDHTFLVAEFD